MSLNNQPFVSIAIGSSKGRPVVSQTGSVPGQADKDDEVQPTQDGRPEAVVLYNWDCEKGAVLGDHARPCRSGLVIAQGVGIW